MLFVGVDLGTSAVKLLLMDENGKIKNIVSKEYPLYFPHPGWSEQKPEDWFAQSIEGLKELLEGFDKDQVKGISFGGQMHGLVVLDKEDQVIRPAILWNDGRTAKQTDYLNQVIGKEKLSEYTANIAFAGFTAPKILWMKENEPENFAKIAEDHASEGLPCISFVRCLFAQSIQMLPECCFWMWSISAGLQKCLRSVVLQRHSFQSCMKAGKSLEL